MKDNGIDVMIISVIGLTLFELIFEAHAKYLYTYIPFFVMLSVIGLHTYYTNFMISKEKGLRQGGFVEFSDEADQKIPTQDDRCFSQKQETL